MRCKSSFQWFPAMLHNPCSSAVASSASPRCAPPPNAGGSTWKVFCCAGRRASSSVQPPTVLAYATNFAVIGSIGPDQPQPGKPVPQLGKDQPGPIPPELAEGPVYWRDAPPPPATVPGCPPRCAACAPLPVCQRPSLWAPFFCGFHRLAVDDGSPFGKLKAGSNGPGCSSAVMLLYVCTPTLALPMRERGLLVGCAEKAASVEAPIGWA